MVARLDEEISNLLNASPDVFARDYMSETMRQRFSNVGPEIIQLAIKLIAGHLPASISCCVPDIWSPASAEQPGAILGTARSNGGIFKPRLILHETFRECGDYGISVAGDVSYVERFASDRSHWTAWPTRPEILSFHEPLVNCAPDKRDEPPPADLIAFISRMGEEMRRARPVVDPKRLFYPALLERSKGGGEERRSARTPPPSNLPNADHSSDLKQALIAEIDALPMLTPEEASRAIRPISELVSFALSEVRKPVTPDDPKRRAALEILQALRVWVATTPDLLALLPVPAPALEEDELAALASLLSRVRAN